MPKSRVRQGHEEKVQKRNQKTTKIMSEQVNEQKQEVRPTPQWSSKEEFSITGLELDYIYNYLTSVQPALAAATSILNRGIMDGKIKMKWEKEENGKFVPMSTDEAKPHQEEFDKMIALVKSGEQPSQTGLEPQEDTVVE